MAIDLNADVGESFGDWRTDDAAILRSVTSASVACGGHCGDAESMRRTVDLAVQHGVSVGAHVSYADREGFGRRPVEVAPGALSDLLHVQIEALQQVAAASGTTVRYVKPHGALYNRAARDEQQALSVVEAVRRAGSGLALVALPGGALARVADDAGLRVVGEAFLDRAYRDDGSLVPRAEPGAVVHDAEQVLARAVDLALRGGVTASSGAWLDIAAGTLCLHGDTGGAADLLAAVRAALEEHGVEVRAFT